MKKANTIALVGMIISIVSISCCTVSPFISVIFAATGGICSLIGYRKSCQETFEQPYEKLALVGIIVGIISFILNFGFILIMVVVPLAIGLCNN